MKLGYGDWSSSKQAGGMEPHNAPELLLPLLHEYNLATCQHAYLRGHPYVSSAGLGFFCPAMELEKLGEDAILCILTCLDSDADIARASAVCRSWQQLVIEGRLWRRLCARKFPELEGIREVQDSESKRCGSVEEHLIFQDIYNRISRGSDESCLRSALHASSTDNPEEDISKTLYPHPSHRHSPSYWSSEGQQLGEVPETLTYQMAAPLCLVREIKLRPFEAYFQHGRPIYSSKYLRFKFGHRASKEQPKSYVWTHVSQIFTMEQSDTLQTFVLPAPVLCVGGIFQVELLERVQKQRMDDLYYICICHVRVIGKPLRSYELKIPEGLVLQKLREPLPEPEVHQMLPDDEELEEEEEEDDDDQFPVPPNGEALAQFLLATRQMNEMFEEYRMTFH